MRQERVQSNPSYIGKINIRGAATPATVCWRIQSQDDVVKVTFNEDTDKPPVQYRFPLEMTGEQAGYLSTRNLS